MGTATTPTVLRGLLVPDPRFRWDADGVSATSQAGPRPGIPVAQQDTDMVLEAAGTQAATSQLRIRTMRGGHPEPGGAAFVWRYEGDTATQWRGWDPPIAISGHEAIEWTSTADEWKSPHARTLSDDTVLVAASRSDQAVSVWRRPADTGVWTEIEVYDRGSDQTYSLSPCLVVLPDGRVLLFFWVDSDGLYQVRMYYSIDGGLTWDLGQTSCLPTAIDPAEYHPGRIRGDVLDGQVCLVIHQVEQGTPEDRLVQYASTDLGASFTQVVEWDGKNHAYCDVLTYGGRLLVAYVTESDSSPGVFRPYVRAIGSAFADFTDSEAVLMQDDGDGMIWASESGGLYDDGEITLWVDQDGALYVLGRDVGSAEHEVSVRVSYDAGATWGSMGSGLGTHDGVSVWRGLDTATYPKNIAVTMQRGRAVMAHRCVSGSGGGDDSLFATYLGGYSTVTLPQEAGGTGQVATATGWTLTWLPLDYPDAMGTTWTSVTAGTPTVLIGATGMVVQHGGGADAQSWYTDLVADLATGAAVLVEIKVTGGFAVVDLRISDGAGTAYSARVTVSTTQIVLRDLYAGADIDDVTTTEGTSGVQVLLSMRNNDVEAWYCPVTAASTDRVWVRIGTSSALTSGVSSTARVTWGTPSVNASAHVHWRLVGVVDDAFTGDGLVGQDNPTDLSGRAYAATPVAVDAGTAIQAIDGPTMRGDDWNIDPRYEYPISAAWPDVALSPRRGWRSTTDASAQTVSWAVGDTGTHLMGSLVGIYLGGCNFGTATLWAKNSLDVWVSICTLDLRVKTALKWKKADRVVVPDPTGGSDVGRYLPTDILAGDHIKLSTENDTVRLIQHNSAGVWTASTTSLTTRLLLSTTDGTEGTSGSSAEIWSRDYLCVVPIDQTQTYKAWKIVIGAQDTYEGYFTIGSLVFGHVFPLGSYLMQYGWGRALEWATSIEQVEGRSGIRAAQALGPVRRSAEVSWVDGVETSGLLESSPSWAIGWTTGEAVAVPADIPWSMPGLLSQLYGTAGAAMPVVYCGAIALPSAIGSPVHVTDRRQLLYGRIASESLRADNVLGDETGTEILRLGTVRIEEEV